MPNEKPSKAQRVKAEIKKEVDKIPPTTDRNLMAALGYAWLISVVMLMVKRNDEFVRFHAKQGLILFIGSLLAFIPLLGVLIVILSWIGMVVGFIQAWQGKRFEIPFVYKLSQKIKF